MCGNIVAMCKLIKDGADVDYAAKSMLEGAEMITTPLLQAAVGGNVDAARVLISRMADVNKADKNGVTPLYLAADDGNLPLIQLLISKGARLDASDKDGRTPLHRAAENGHQEAVSCLLDHGAEVHASDNDGSTPLQLAVEEGHVPVIQLLVLKEARVDAKNTKGRTPLHRNAVTGHMDAAICLADSGADVNATDDHGDTPLYVAAGCGHVPLITFLRSRGANIFVKNEKGQTPLHFAAQGGHVEAATYLLDHGADINARSIPDEVTPLRLAVMFKRLSMIKLLLICGADPDLPDDKGQTPLICVSNNTFHEDQEPGGEFEIAKILVERGASVNQSDNVYGGRPLYYAAANGDLPLISLLIAHGADCNLTSKKGQTPLHFAAQKGHIEAATYLQDHGANINAQSVPDEFTPLRLAAVCQRLAMIELLLTCGADPDLPDHIGQTPLICEASEGNVEAATYLLDHGAEINVQDVNGRTPLAHAVHFKHLPVVNLLLLRGADPDLPDNENGTPLHDAVSSFQNDELCWDLGIIERLCEGGANLNQADEGGMSPLHMAAQKGHLRAVRFLVKNGADIHQADMQGANPLHHASFHNQSEVVAYLIKKGANFDHQGNVAKACKCCGATDVPLKVCSGCELVWYCGPECQKKDWKEGGENQHKIQCPRIKEQMLLNRETKQREIEEETRRLHEMFGSVTLMSMEKASCQCEHCRGNQKASPKSNPLSQGAQQGEQERQDEVDMVLDEEEV